MALKISVSQKLFEKVQETMGTIGWFLSLLSGMLRRSWSHRSVSCSPGSQLSGSWCIQRHGRAQGEPAPRLCRGDSSKGDQGVCPNLRGSCALGTSRLGRGRNWVGAQLGTCLLAAACLLPNPNPRGCREPWEH